MGEGSAVGRIGWIGIGRMGFELATRLLDAGVAVRVYNRTRSKAEPLAAKGGELVDAPADLAGCDIVFTCVARPEDVVEVLFSETGLLSGDETPSIVVDITTIDEATSAEIRDRAAERGTAFVVASVSGNPSVVRSGDLTIVVSGRRNAFEEALPYLEKLGKLVTYAGPADEARLVKICHNLMLGAVSQMMAETCVLLEKAGVPRESYLSFLNESVMGSGFTRYKTPALVNLDFTPTFTWELLRKDFEIGLAAGRKFDAPLPVSALVHQILVDGIGAGYTDQDFASLIARSAAGAGIQLTPDAAGGETA